MGLHLLLTRLRRCGGAGVRWPPLPSPAIGGAAGLHGSPSPSRAAARLAPLPQAAHGRAGRWAAGRRPPPTPPPPQHPPPPPFSSSSFHSRASSSVSTSPLHSPRRALASSSPPRAAVPAGMDCKDKPRKSSSAASMAALVAAAAAGDGADGIVPPPGEEDKKPKLVTVPVAAVGASSSSAAAGAAARRGGAAGGAVATGGSGGPSCQAERCGADLSEAKRYHRRHKVCEAHSKAAVVLVAGLRQRFCQQCSRFHELSEFDETKRSCRRRLAGHNERRRKSSAESHGDGCRHVDPDSRSHPGNPPLNHYQIR